eukprot:scaffold1318_cov388-Prasinococcus_capsulatus_cf.AAC.37
MATATRGISCPEQQLARVLQTRGAIRMKDWKMLSVNGARAHGPAKNRGSRPVRNEASTQLQALVLKCQVEAKLGALVQSLRVDL